MMRRLPAAAVTLTLVLQAAAPGTAAAQEKAARKAYEYDLIVSGCLRGKRLERAVVVTAPDALPIDRLNEAQYALEGPKALIRDIEQHRSHNDQVMGVATIPPTTFLGSGPTRRLGPFSVGIGARPDQLPGMERRETIIKLKVSSFVHTGAECPR